METAAISAALCKLGPGSESGSSSNILFAGDMGEGRLSQSLTKFGHEPNVVAEVRDLNHLVPGDGVIRHRVGILECSQDRSMISQADDFTAIDFRVEVAD